MPHNQQQMVNYRRSEHTRDQNVLYSVMPECKVAQGVEETFSSLTGRCKTWSLFWNILTVNTTYNLGHFYVTPTTYPHLMLEDIATKKHPTMLGPVLVHQRMQFPSFKYFGATLVGLNK